MKIISINLKNKLKKINKRRFFTTAIFSFLLAFSLVIGKQMNETRMLEWSIRTPLNILITFCVIEPITYYFVDKIRYKQNQKFEVKRWQIFLPLFLVSFFVLFATYPGNYNIDATYEYQLYKSDSLGTHFPIFYNFVFCSLLEFLHSIFNNWEMPVFILNFIQIVVLDLAIAEVIFFLSKRLKNKKFTIISTLFYVTNPLFLTLSMSTSHDIGFGAIFALIVIEIIKLVEEDDYFKYKKNWFKLIFLIFMLCIFRNNGLFAIVPALILSLFFMKGKRIKFAAIITIPLLLFIGYNQLIVNNIVKTKESVFRESLNVPINQIARALYYNYPRAFIPEEQYKFFYLECNWPDYGKHPMITDYQKVCLKTDYLDQHFIDFVKYWFTVGKNVPHRYIEAPLLFELGAYYPFITYYESKDLNPTLSTYVNYSVHGEPKDVNIFIDIHRYPNIKIIDKIMYSLIQKQNWNKIAFFRVIWSGSFTTFLLIFAACYACYKKQKKYLVPLCFIFGMLLTVMLSPVILFRYMFPIVLCIPAMIYIIAKSSEKR